MPRQRRACDLLMAGPPDTSMEPNDPLPDRRRWSPRLATQLRKVRLSARLQDRGTPTAVLVRQVLGAISKFEKTRWLPSSRARDRKKAVTGKCGGRKNYAERSPEMVALA